MTKRKKTFINLFPRRISIWVYGELKPYHNNFIRRAFKLGVVVYIHKMPNVPRSGCAYQPIHDRTTTPPKSTIGEISKIANDFRDSQRRLNAAINNAKKVKDMNEFDFIQWSIDNGFGKVEFNLQQMNVIAHLQQHINNDIKHVASFTNDELNDITKGIKERMDKINLKDAHDAAIILRLYGIIAKVKSMLR